MYEFVDATADLDEPTPVVDVDEFSYCIRVDLPLAVKPELVHRLDLPVGDVLYAG